MKKFFALALITFTISAFTFAQNVGQMQDDTLVNYMDINNKKQGKWIKYYDSGKIRYKGQFLNDIPTGTFMFYHSNGKIKSLMNYDDEGASTCEIFWKTGNNAAKGSYNVNRDRIKEWKIYFEDGTLASIINYNLLGEPDGNIKMYYPDTKQLVLDCNYKNGDKVGDYKKYFPTGIPQELGPYADNLKHGYWKFYSPEGVLEEEGSYINGKREGEWIRYTDDQGTDTVNFVMDRADNYDEQMQEWRDKQEWAKENQHLFKQPENYLDNPIEFFKK